MAHRDVSPTCVLPFEIWNFIETSRNFTIICDQYGSIATRTILILDLIAEYTRLTIQKLRSDLDVEIGKYINIIESLSVDYKNKYNKARDNKTCK